MLLLSQAVHRTHDPNLTREKDTDLLEQLKSKHRLMRQNRERRFATPMGSRAGSLRRRHVTQRRNTLQSLTIEPQREDHFRHVGLTNLGYINEDEEGGMNGRYSPTSDRSSRRMSEPVLMMTPLRKYPIDAPVLNELNINHNNLITEEDEWTPTENGHVWTSNWDHKF